MKVLTITICLLTYFNSLSQTEDDCVFNNNYKELTTEWLTELGKTNFTWNEKSNQAEIYSDEYEINVSKGGCYHFGKSVKLKISNDSNAIDNFEYWLNKAMTLATEFNFEHYQKMIEQNKVKLVENGENLIWFEIEDDNLDDNLYYSGVEINLEGESKVISISQYYN